MVETKRERRNMSKRTEHYYDENGKLVKSEIKKKKNPFLLGCGGLLLLFILLGACGAMFGTSDTDTEEDTTTETTTTDIIEDDTEEVVEEETDTPETEAPIEEETEEEVTEEETDDTGEVSREFEAALQSAQNYVDNMPFSKKGLYDQLTSEHGSAFPEDAANYAIENVDVDYKEEAVEAANNYNETFPMSDQELLDQLTSDAGDGYTMEEAQFALENMDK